MINKESTNSILLFIKKEWLLIFLLAVILTDVFKTTGSYIGLFITPLVWIKSDLKRSFDSNFLMLVLFSGTYVLFMLLNNLYKGSIGLLLFHLLYPVTFYILGRYLMKKWYDQIYFLFFMLISFLSLPSLVSIYSDIIANGFLNETRSVYVDHGETAMSATLHGVRLSLFVVMIGLMFAKVSSLREKMYQYMFLLLSVLSIIANVHLVNRTALAIMIISLVLVFILNIKHYKISNTIAVSFLILLITVSAFYFLNTNKEVIDLYTYRNRSDGSGVTDVGGRLIRWESALNLIVNEPLGGGAFKYGYRYYAHNFWLDVAEMAGIIPAIVILVFTIVNLRKNYHLIIHSNTNNIFFLSILLALNLGFLLTFFVEPIYEANPPYVFLYFCLMGIVSETLQQKQRTRLLKRYLNMIKSKSQLRIKQKNTIKE